MTETVQHRTRSASFSAPSQHIRGKGVEPHRSSLDDSVDSMRMALPRSRSESSLYESYEFTDDYEMDMTAEMTQRVGMESMARTPGRPTADFDVTMPEAKPRLGTEVLMIRDPEEDFDAANYTKYLNGNKAQLVFSTAAMPGEGVSRSVDLTKKVDEEQTADDERQEKFNVEFAKIKHVLGLGGRAGKPNLPADVNISKGFVTVYFPDGPKVYDLLEHSEIKRLLNDVSMENVNDSMVEKAFTRCRGSIREMAKLSEREAGKQKDIYVHDYVGNPHGLDMNRATSMEIVKVRRDARHGRRTEKLKAMEHVEKSGTFSRARLTDTGADAFNNILQLNYLQESMLNHLRTKATEKESQIALLRSQGKMDEANAAQKELNSLMQAFRTLTFDAMQQDAMERDILYLEGSHTIDLPQWNGVIFDKAEAIKGRELMNPSDTTVKKFLRPDDQSEKAIINKRQEIQMAFLKKVAQYEEADISQGNKTWTRWGIIPYRKPHETKTDQRKNAVGVALQMKHMSQTTTPLEQGGKTERLEMLQADQKLSREAFTRRDDKGYVTSDNLGSETFKMPEGERFMLHALEGLKSGKTPEEVLGTFSNASPIVQSTLKIAMAEFVMNKDDEKMNEFQAGQTYDSKKVAKKGREQAPLAPPVQKRSLWSRLPTPPWNRTA